MKLAWAQWLRYGKWEVPCASGQDPVYESILSSGTLLHPVKVEHIPIPRKVATKRRSNVELGRFHASGNSILWRDTRMSGTTRASFCTNDSGPLQM